MFETLEITRECGLTWVTLNRPDALNAMNGPLVRELRQFLWELPGDRETRVVVLRIAGESARMNAAFIRLGLSACDVGVSYFLPRLVGASVAAELLLPGNFIDAARAERVGLVSRVVPDAQLEPAARELAGDMLRNTPLGLQLTPRNVSSTRSTRAASSRSSRWRIATRYWPPRGRTSPKRWRRSSRSAPRGSIVGVDAPER